MKSEMAALESQVSTSMMRFLMHVAHEPHVLKHYSRNYKEVPLLILVFAHWLIQINLPAERNVLNIFLGSIKS